MVYYVKRWFFRKLFKILGKTPDKMPMVKYWKTQSAVAAKVFTDKNGVTVMKMEGEDELFPGFPRGHLIVNTPGEYTDVSKLKHEIKNQIFNESWKMLEEGKPAAEIIKHIKGKFTGGLQTQLDKIRYEMIPPSKMCIPVREIWRVLEKMETKEPKLRWLKETLTFILQEDDAYRMRLLWVIQIFRPRWWNNPVKLLEIALKELEVAEVIGDMKERVRLWTRTTLFALKDPHIYQLFQEFCREVDWSKLKLTKADKYHFRAKYFKVDLDKFEY